MAISLKASGTWVNLVNTAGPAIPGSPAAGDRMFLFATWKSYSMTPTTPTGWTAIGTQYADGTDEDGNGDGSMAVMAWYRDWVSGDANPVLTGVGTQVSGGAAVVQVWSKDSGDTWDTPLTENAAWPTNTGSVEQQVSANGTLAVPDDSVVFAMFGLPDNVVTMTRSTTAIDAASGITWDGNYVESPATHHSSSLDLDAAADLGHRFVTTGGTVTLRMSSTNDQAQNGAVLFVVQGVTGTPPTPSDSGSFLPFFYP